MKKFALLLLFIATETLAGPHLDLGLGASYLNLKGKTTDIQPTHGVATQLAIGHQWTNWGIGLLGTYALSRQSSFQQDYDDKIIRDDFYAHSASATPYVSYKIYEKENSWNLTPFIGPHISYLGLESSTTFNDPQGDDDENISSENLGYGGTFGLNLRHFAQESSWLESVTYRISYQYTRFRDTEATYDINQSEQEYDGETPDKLKGHSIVFTVGLTLGNKIGRKLVDAL